MEHASATPVTMDAVLAIRRTGWFADRGIMLVNLVLCLSLISSYATGYDGSMMNGLQSLDTWNSYFNEPGPRSLALLNAINSVGQLIAVPFCAVFCDYFGRKATLLFGAFVMLVGVILQGAAQNTGMFIAARGILGLGTGFNTTAAPLLVLELAFPTQRAPMVSVYNALYSLGSIVAAWTTYGTFNMGNDWAWRIPSYLQALSSAVQLLACYFIVESPRWLVSKGKDEKAREILTKYHANGDAQDAIVAIELQEIREALRLEEESLHNSSYASFYKTKGNRHRFAIILAVGFFSQWSGNGIISYYLTYVLDSIGYKSEGTQTLLNGILSIWNLVTTMFFALVVNKFGRRTLFLASTGLMLACFIVWTALEATYEKTTDLSGGGSSGVAKGVLAMIFLYNLAFNMGWGPLQVTYVIEILPYHLRARGLVLYNLFVALALIFNQYANPVGLTNIEWKYYIVYDVWLAVEFLVVYFLFIEVKDMSLEETAAILDGVEVKEKITEGVARATDVDNKIFRDDKAAGELRMEVRGLTL